MDAKSIIRFGPGVLRSIAAEAASGAPLEVCGYLAGPGDRILLALPLRNMDASSEHFMFDPSEQFKAVRTIRSLGYGLMGVYHSHPSSPARLSEEDLRWANDESLVYGIFSVPENAFRIYRVTAGKQIVPLEYDEEKES